MGDDGTAGYRAVFTDPTGWRIWTAATISYFGDFGAGGIIGGIGFFRHVLDQGGNDDLGLWGGLLAVAVWSLIIYFIAINKRLPGHKVDEYVAEVYPPPVAE